MTKRIAIDIDGVVANLMEKTVRYFGEPQVRGVYSLEEMYPSVSDHDLGLFLIANWTYESLPIYADALNAIRELEKHKWEIFYVTARPSELYDTTMNWLSDFRIRHPVVFSYTKDIDIYGLECDAAVEDNLEEAKSIARICPTYLINRDYNSGSCAPAVRVRGWEEILEKLLYEHH